MSHEIHLTGVDHSLDHIMTINYIPDMFISYPGYLNEELEPRSSSVVSQYYDSNNDSGMDIPSHYLMNVI